MENPLEELTLIPEPAEQYLNERQIVDYREHRKQLLSWLLAFGKNPDQAEGYAVETVKTRTYRIDQFYRWVWSQEGGYTTQVSTEHADEWMKELAYSDKSNVHKNNCLKALKMLFKWRHHRFNEDSWEPEMTFQVEHSSPQDYLTRQERTEIREAVLEYGSIPSKRNTTSSTKEEYDVEYHEIYAYELLKEAGLSLRTARPRHHEADPEEKAEFQQTVEKNDPN